MSDDRRPVPSRSRYEQCLRAELLAEEGQLGLSGCFGAVAQREQVPALLDAVELSAGDLARRVLAMAEAHVAVVRAVHDQRRAAHLAERQLLDRAELFDIVVPSGAKPIEQPSVLSIFRNWPTTNRGRRSNIWPWIQLMIGLVSKLIARAETSML